MKRIIVSLSLFSMLFTFFAAAEEIDYSKFYDMQEACYQGYKDKLYEEYDYHRDDLSSFDADMYLKMMEFLCENFESGMPAEERDPELMKQAYEYGYDFGQHDYYVLVHTIDQSRETLYNQGYQDGSYDAIYDEEENTEQEERIYQEGFDDGYAAGKEEKNNSFTYKVGSYVLGIALLCGAGYLIVFVSGLFKRKRK